MPKPMHLGHTFAPATGAFGERGARSSDEPGSSSPAADCDRSVGAEVRVLGDDGGVMIRFILAPSLGRAVGRCQFATSLEKAAQFAGLMLPVVSS